MSPAFAPPDAPSLPLHIVTAEGLDGFLAASPQAGWLRAAGFEAGLGELVLLPGPDGISGAVAGLGTDKARRRSRFGLARAFAALPAGDWHLDGPLTPAQAEARGLKVNQDGQRRDALQLLAYPSISFAELAAIWPELGSLSRQAREQLEIDAMYSGYLERQALDVEAFKRDEDLRLSPDLDYAAVGPEHAWLHDEGRVEYTYATDDKALDAFMKLARLEGIIPALESAHAVAECIARAPKMRKDELIIVNLSGRGDKDVAQAAAKVGLQMPK